MARLCEPPVSWLHPSAAQTLLSTQSMLLAKSARRGAGQILLEKTKKEQHLNRSTKRLLDNRNSCRVQKKLRLCPEIAEWLKSATPGALCVPPPLTLDQTLTKYSFLFNSLLFRVKGKITPLMRYPCNDYDF